MVEADGLKKWFPVRRGLADIILRRPPKFIRAVDGVSFAIKRGEIFCLAGESGCGKTTTGRLILRLEEPTAGRILFKGVDITNLDGEELIEFRRKAQIIFQDPYESLNPHMRVIDIISEPLSIHKLAHNREEVIERVTKTLEDVALKPPEEFMYRYPHELSGGQRQRVAIARAIILQPEFIVADEPVSMLDMSIRAEILDLMLGIRDRYGIAYLFITHDLAVAKHICDRIAIMYLGKVVELGEATEVIDNPLHPYTKALTAAIPVPDPRVKIGEIPIKGEVPSPINPPSGCRFHPRCPYAMDICSKKEPGLKDVEKGRKVACHLYG
ncbi:oligopeptide ABC transporter ATP-binding protein [Candidatus Bathyarchaeota archaeon]|nr:MAG: oligopeptide ABC transporter ATP-binding protein [Candidatus Bathyarchaeota archaeon]